MIQLIINIEILLKFAMKTKTILLLIVAALIPLGSAAQSAAAEELHIQASFYPYYDFTKIIAGSAAHVEQFLPFGVEAHDWEPGVSKSLTLLDTDVFVYNGLGIEMYVERLEHSGDYSHMEFVKATDGLALISTTEFEEMILTEIDEYESAGFTKEAADVAIEAITNILDTEEIRHTLEDYKSGVLTKTEALAHIVELTGLEHDGHDDHGHDTHDDGHDDHGHDTHDDGHDDHDDQIIADVRAILEEIHDGDTTYEVGLEEIHVMLADEDHDHGHDDHGGQDDHAHDHGEFDPHVWLDPVLAIHQVENIRDALMEIDPDNADTYEDNAAAYILELDELHDKYSATLTNCQHNTIVTLHGAFAYMVERYGFETFALGGTSGTDTISTATIVELVKYVEDNNIEYLLGDDVIDTRTLEVIAEETGAQVLTLSPIEGVTVEEYESGVSYISRMEANLADIKTALACQ